MMKSEGTPPKWDFIVVFVAEENLEMKNMNIYANILCKFNLPQHSTSYIGISQVPIVITNRKVIYKEVAFV